jgi:epsilon-lactone hydrolase
VKLNVLHMAIFFVSLNCGAQVSTMSTASRAAISSDGTVLIPPLAVPLSSYMSEEAKRAFVKKSKQQFEDDVSKFRQMSDIEMRKWVDDLYRPKVEHAQSVCPVNIEKKKIAGVETDIIEPKSGSAPGNLNRVLISLHGGGYSYASGGQARLIEAVPVAGCAKIKVVSVNYALSPKSRWPAAIREVTAVYRELLERYNPENIGIYGCSTGATLGANLIAWWQKERIPRPGAIGLFCDGAVKDDEVDGDSYYFGGALEGWPTPEPGRSYTASLGSEPYMEGTDADDPLVRPVGSLDVLSKFPSTLLISGTRDMGLSAVVYTHSRLIKSGVEAELHVWEGMWHGFYLDIDLPESQEAYGVIRRFFDKHLGRSPAGHRVNVTPGTALPSTRELK